VLSSAFGVGDGAAGYRRGTGGYAGKGSLLLALDLCLLILLHPRGKALIDLFTAVDEGEIALMTAPPAGAFRLRADNDRQHRWIRDHWTHRPQNLWSMLQVCVDSCQSTYGHFLKGVAIAELRKDISRDLVLMRQQPVIMGEYRRYVVLDSKSSSSGVGVSRFKRYSCVVSTDPL